MGGGGVEEFDKARARSRRAIVNFVEDQTILGGIVGPGKADGNLPGRSRDDLAATVQSLHLDRVVAGIQQRFHCPGGVGSPPNRHLHAVHAQGVDGQGSVPCQSDPVHRARSASQILGARAEGGRYSSNHGSKIGDASPNPGLDRSGRRSGDPGRLEGGESGVQERIEAIGLHGAIGNFSQIPIIGPPILWSGVDASHRAVAPVVFEEVVTAWTRRAGIAENDVGVPHDQLPAAPLRPVGIHVLRIAVTEAVPVPDCVVEGERFDPHVHVRLLLQCVRKDRIVARGVGRVDQGIEVAVIIDGSIGRPGLPVPPVTSHLARASGGPVIVQVRPRQILKVQSLAGLPAKFEPGVDLPQVAVRIVGVIGADEVAAAHLRVFHQPPAQGPVDIDVHIAPVQPREAELAGHPVHRLLPLDGAVVEGAVAGTMDLVEAIGAEEKIVAGEAPDVMAVAGGAGEVLMIRAAGEAESRSVDGAKVSIYQGAVHGLIA